MSQSKAKELSGLQPLPIRHRFLISTLFALSAFILLIVNLLYNSSILPSHDLGNWFFCGTIIAAFLLPLLRFPNKHYNILIPLGVLLAWFMALNLIIAPIVLREDTAKGLAEAANILPTNAVLIPSKTTYNQAVATVGGPGVAYYYKSTNPQEDYHKIHDFYKDYLTQRGWKVINDYKGDWPSIGFNKDGQPAIVNIYLQNDPIYPILVGIGLRYNTR